MGQHAEALTQQTATKRKRLNYYMNTEISEESEQNDRGYKDSNTYK